MAHEHVVDLQVRLHKDHPNRAKFEPEHGLDPTLDLALISADWQLKVQGRARNWQDNIVVSSTRTGEKEDLTKTEVSSIFCFCNQILGKAIIFLPKNYCFHEVLFLLFIDMASPVLPF